MLTGNPLVSSIWVEHLLGTRWPGPLGSEADGSCQAGDWITLVSGLALWAQNLGFQKPLSIYKRTKLFRLQALMPLVSQQKSEGFPELHSISSSYPEVSTLTAPRPDPGAMLSGFSGSKYFRCSVIAQGRDT